MITNFTTAELLEKAIKLFSISTIRYLIFAGTAFLIFYVIMKEKWSHKRVQQKYPGKEYIWYEIKYSMLNMLIFMITGLCIAIANEHGITKMYKHISEYGTGYFIFSIIAMIFIHDTYFYWGHRFMHLKKVYPIVHKVHHHSINPTPWASFTFHPIEGFIEAGIVPLIVMIMPAHGLAVFIFVLFSTLLNVMGHLGFEMYPSGFTKSKWLGWNNTSTHHNMHHKFFECNYGLYFNFWDKLMGTNHEDYHETFEKVANQKADSPQ
jgi:Delta7-sterol 5-desaturase